MTVIKLVLLVCCHPPPPHQPLDLALAIKPNLEAFLVERWTIRAGEKLFPYDFWSHYPALLGVLKRACVAVGIPAGIAGVTFHTTRHTSISTMVAAGADISPVMKVAGHTQIRTTERYFHSVTDSIEQAVESLNFAGMLPGKQELGRPQV